MGRLSHLGAHVIHLAVPGLSPPRAILRAHRDVYLVRVVGHPEIRSNIDSSPLSVRATKLAYLPATSTLQSCAGLSEAANELTSPTPRRSAMKWAPSEVGFKTQGIDSTLCSAP